MTCSRLRISASFTRSALLLAALVAWGAACTKSGTSSSAQQGEEPLAEKGKRLYLSHCIACHSADPTKSGSLGPEIWGSSKELLSARILRAEYPPGYKPKRDTKVMTPFPYLGADIDAFHAYLGGK